MTTEKAIPAAPTAALSGPADMVYGTGRIDASGRILSAAGVAI
jgi:hypothetical protein